jgi:DNA-binding transcriptional ArsR family regulator
MYGEDEEEKITIDKKTFKTLASDTRIGILKSLNVRRKTLSELAKEHRMSVSTVKEHLDNLVGAGLIVQMDDGHKWKYYELTRKGSAVLNPEEKKVWIMLSLSLLAAIAAGLDAVTGVFSRVFMAFASNAERSPQIFGGGRDIITAPTAPIIENATEKAASAAVADTAVQAVNNTSAATGTSGAAPSLLPEASADAASQSIGQILPVATGPPAPIPWLHIAVIIVFAALAAYLVFRLRRKRNKGKNKNRKRSHKRKK